MRIFMFLIFCAGCSTVCHGAETPTIEAPQPFGAIPSARQLQWHKMEFYGFLHFTVNTFTGKEWGYGDESEHVFNPTALDTRQWARVARDAGMKGLIFTAKHHDGFCLWPSKHTEHSVKNAPWKGGKGDVLQELSKACGKFSLKMGVYLSPWDRNHAEYGKPEYIDYYRKQLTDVLTNYGEVFEVWHDGANGGDGYYGGAREKRSIDNKTYYKWQETWAMIRKLQPNAVIFSDAGPDCRWVGNEKGYAPDTCWATINPKGMYPGHADRKVLGHGTPNGNVWRPAEVDVSLRRGWFFHENQAPKTVTELLNIYYNSVGHGACLLLNLTPDKRGLIPEQDVKRMQEFGAIIAQTFKTDLAEGKPAKASNVRGGSRTFAVANVTDGKRNTYWATDDNILHASITIDLQKQTRINRIRVQEFIPLGQRIKSFTIEAHTNNGWEKVAEGTTIGARRILRFPSVHADIIRLHINESLACPTISTIEMYLATTEDTQTD